MSGTDLAGTSAAGPKEAAAWPGRRSAWATTLILCGAYILAYVDRQAINVLAPAIKQDLQISDLVLSYLQGGAFVVPYALLGLPLGYLTDRVNRVRLVSAAVLAWSVMTMACGTARHLQLFGLFRAGVGVGEAALNPGAVSLISDNFPRQDRARALAVFNVGSTLGAATAFLFLALLIPKSDVTLPILGTLRPWQVIFLELGAIGIPYAALMLRIREPLRRGAEPGSPPAASYGEALAFLRANWTLFLPFMAGMTCLALIAYGPASATTLFFTRTFGMSVREIAAINGVLILFTAVPGALIGGTLASRWRRGGAPEATLKVISLATAGLIGPIVFTYLAPAPWIAWVSLGVQSVFVASSINLGNAALAEVVPNRLRGKVVAMYSMILAFIGLGFGPFLIALITDLIIRDESLIRYSLSIFGGVFTPLALAMLLISLPAYRRVAAAAVD